MSTYKVGYKSNYLPGGSLNTNFNPARQAFDVTTLPTLFDQDEFTKIKLTSNGGQESVFELVMDAKSKVRTLGVGGSLKLTCGPVSGDANVKFAMDNINNGLSLSIIYRITREGQSRRVDYSDLGQLKLSEAVSKQIDTEKLSFDQFKKQYGSYIIIGFKSGGEIIYDMTYETNNSQDKESVSGGLAVAYNKVPGFSISGNVTGNYTKNDISKSLNVNETYNIHPSTNSDNQLQLIESLNNLTTMTQQTDSTDFDIANLKNNIDKFANNVLNDDDEQKLDWTQAIIYPIDSIPCVADKFTTESIEQSSISGFLQHLNNLYIDLKSKAGDMSEMANIWLNSPEIFTKYALQIDKIIQLINTLTDYSSLYKFGTEYNDYIRGENNENDEKSDNNDINIQQKQIDLSVDEFYKIDDILLDKQYRNDIFIPYNDYVDSLNAKATLTVWCDDWVTVILSKDGGKTFNNIIVDKYGKDKWTGMEGKKVEIKSINKDTVLKFDCYNRKGQVDELTNKACFMATIEYKDNQYSTPGYFKCISKQTSAYPNTDTLQCWLPYSNVINNWPMNTMAVWPQLIAKNEEMETFQFKFSDIIN